MTTDVELSEDDVNFIAAANQLQELGLFPSQKNLARHTSYRLPHHGQLMKKRQRLVAMGALMITTEPKLNNQSNLGLPKEEREIVVALVEQRPKLSIRQIYRRFMKQTGRRTRSIEVMTLINRIRDEVELGGLGSGPCGETRIAERVKAENRDENRPTVNRIMDAELLRYQLANIERLTPAQASAAILKDWKQRFSGKQSKGRMAFTEHAYTTDSKSVRAERERTVSYSRRGMPYAMEAMTR